MVDWRGLERGGGKCGELPPASSSLPSLYPAACSSRSKGPSLQHFVAVQIVQLLCRTVKLGWFDHDSHRAIVDDVKRIFLDKGQPGHYLLGLRVLNTLVQEMNLPTAGRTLTQQRKTATNFRDTCLFKVFQMALFALQEMLQKGADSRLKEQGLALASQCLSYDFVGTCLDDSSEEMCTIQVRTKPLALGGAERQQRRHVHCPGLGQEMDRPGNPPAALLFPARSPPPGGQWWRSPPLCSSSSTTTRPPHRPSQTWRWTAWWVGLRILGLGQESRREPSSTTPSPLLAPPPPPN
jgi:hypothetical protein